MTDLAAEVIVPQLMTVKELRTLLKLSQPSIYRLMERGELPYVRLGKSRRVKREDVARFIERNTVARASHD